MSRANLSPRVRRAMLAGATLALGGCVLSHHQPPRPPDPTTVAAAEWPEARRVAMNAAIARDYASADSVLRAFAARFPGTAPAAETVFWRALLRLDPGADTSASDEASREVHTWLDAYVATGPTQEHYAEAVVIRRIVARLDSLRAAADAAHVIALGTQTGPVAGGSAARDSLRARDDEIARLRQELDQTKAELDRIRKRLAPPRP